MECKKCGGTVTDEAIFCNHCGARLDGKKLCPSCRQMNDENNAFCVSCGTRIDGKKTCSFCGNVFEGAFCPQCGKKINETVQACKFKESNQSNFPLKLGKAFDLTGSCIAMLGTLLALIFVFFIGVKITGDSTSVLDTGFMGGSVNIFEYFGEYYKDIDYSGLGLTPWFQDFFSSNQITFGLFNTLIGAITIITVITFSILAIVRFVKNLLGLTEKKADKFALAAIFSFFIGATLFFVTHTIDVQMTNSSLLGSSSSVYTKMSATTQAGVILCAICAGLFGAFKIASMGKALLKKDKIVSLVCAVIGVGLTTALYLFAKNTGMVITAFDEEHYLSWRQSFLMGGMTLAFTAVDSIGTEHYAAVTDYLSIINAFSIIGMIALIATVVCTGASLCKIIGGFSEEKENSNITLSIISCVSAIIMLTAFIISWNNITDLLTILSSAEVAIDTKFTTVICATVFSVFSLVLAIVKKFLNGVVVKKQLP